MIMDMEYRNIIVPTLERMGEGTIRVIFSMEEMEVACLYYERAKVGWTHKPIMPQAWRCVDSKISDVTIYERGIVEPKELVGWGQELIKVYL